MAIVKIPFREQFRRLLHQRKVVDKNYRVPTYRGHTKTLWLRTGGWVFLEYQGNLCETGRPERDLLGKLADIVQEYELDSKP